MRCHRRPGGQEIEKYVVFFQKFKKIRIPHPFMVIVLDAAFTFIFKKRYCFQHDLPGWLVEMLKSGGSGIQQIHKYPFVQMAVVNTFG